MCEIFLACSQDIEFSFVEKTYGKFLFGTFRNIQEDVNTEVVNQ